MYKFIKNDKWLIKQKCIEEKNTNTFYIKERQIWWINIGYNIGKEIYGKGDDFKRPFLVIKRAGNMFIGVLTTTKGNNNSGFYYEIPEGYMDEKSFLIKSQIKSIDKKRFLEKICTISNEDFLNIKNNLKNYIFGD